LRSGRLQPAGAGRRHGAISGSVTFFAERTEAIDDAVTTRPA
jgi:hypothetical protein